jgi:predicted nucleic acid-binding protein
VSKPTVYLETSVLSYLAARKSANPSTALRQAVTRHWWDQERRRFELFVSEAVEVECLRGDEQQVQRRLVLLADASMLPLTESIMELAARLVVPGGLPPGAAADALHVAVAAVYKMDYLATWNIRHIANAQIRRVTERIIEENGYERPVICTPEELFGVDTVEER